MHYSLLLSAGILGMAISVVHGYLGQRRVLTALQADAIIAGQVNKAVFHLSTWYWFIGGLSLVVVPKISVAPAAAAVALGVAILYFSAAAANFWATRGRHFGWVLLAIAGGLAVFGVRGLI